MKLKENPLIMSLKNTTTTKTSEIATFIGTTDELCSYIMALQNEVDELILKSELIDIVTMLFNIMSEVVGGDFKLGEKQLQDLLNLIDKYHDPEEKFNFVLPGITTMGSKVHIIRTIARRCERSYAHLYEKNGGNDYIFEYLNKLSSFFYDLALMYDKKA